MFLISVTFIIEACQSSFTIWTIKIRFYNKHSYNKIMWLAISNNKCLLVLFFCSFFIHHSWQWSYLRLHVGTKMTFASKNTDLCKVDFLLSLFHVVLCCVASCACKRREIYVSLSKQNSWKSYLIKLWKYAVIASVLVFWKRKLLCLWNPGVVMSFQNN